MTWNIAKPASYLLFNSIHVAFLISCFLIPSDLKNNLYSIVYGYLVSLAEKTTNPDKTSLKIIICDALHPLLFDTEDNLSRTRANAKPDPASWSFWTFSFKAHPCENIKRAETNPYERTIARELLHKCVIKCNDTFFTGRSMSRKKLTIGRIAMQITKLGLTTLFFNYPSLVKPSHLTRNRGITEEYEILFYTRSPK